MNVRNIADQVIRVANAGKIAKVFFKGYNKERFKIIVVKDTEDYKIVTAGFETTIEKTFNEFDLAKEIQNILKDVKDAEGMKTKDGMEIYCY